MSELTTTKERVLAAAKLGDRERKCLEQVFPQAFEPTYPFVFLGASSRNVYLALNDSEAIRITGEEIDISSWGKIGETRGGWYFKGEPRFSGTLRFRDGKHVSTEED